MTTKEANNRLWDEQHSSGLSFKQWYGKIYLQSDHWKSLRERALYRDKYKCKICHSTENLNVHHKRYRKIYNVVVGDLVTMCHDCHVKEHQVPKDVRLSIPMAGKLLGLEVNLPVLKKIYPMPEYVWDHFVNCIPRRRRESEHRMSKRSVSTIKKLRKLKLLTDDILLKLTAIRVKKTGRQAREKLGTTKLHHSLLKY